MPNTLDIFSDTQLSKKPQSSSCSRLRRAAWHRVSGVTPYFSRRSASTLPLFTPTRMGTPAARQASATAFTLLLSPMLPGLMRILSMPPRKASSAKR